MNEITLRDYFAIEAMKVVYQVYSGKPIDYVERFYH